MAMEGLIASCWGRFKMQMSRAGVVMVLLAVTAVILGTIHWTLLSLESFWRRFMIQKSWAAGFYARGLVHKIVHRILVVGGILHMMLSVLVASFLGRFKMQISWAGLDEDKVVQMFRVVVGTLHLTLNLFRCRCWEIFWMQFYANELERFIIVEGPSCFMILSWIVFETRLSRWRRLKAQASIRRNYELLVAQQVLKQRDGRSGSSEDILPTTVTSENEVLLGDAEDMDRALGSPDKSQWTAHSPFASSNDETSETEKQDREAQLQKAMIEKLVRDDWPVYSRERVRFGKKFAEGGQAAIYAAFLKPQNRDAPVAVAVKKFKIINGISQGHNPPELKSWLRILNVCRPTGVFFDDGQLCLIMPRLDGDPRAVIDRQMELHSAPPFPKPVAVHIIMQLAMGLKSLHEVGIYHHDLKAANILVEEMKVTMKSLESYKVYISDFESSDNVIGTGFYRAPEVLRVLQVRAEAGLQGRAHGSVRLREHEWGAADVYSFGMVCYEILTGEVPMIGDKWSDFSMALSGHRPELPPDMVPDGLRTMIERCWHEDPQSRPTPSEILHHVKRIDNDGVCIPAPMTAGMEILVDVLDCLFQPVSFLRQQLFPMDRVLDVPDHILGVCHSMEESCSSDADVWKDWLYLQKRESIRKLHMKFHAASMHRNQFALTHGLHIDEKNALLRDFVETQLAAGVRMPSLWYQSEVIIRQVSDTKHRWALRRHLSFLCVKDLLECEVAYMVLCMGFLTKWLVMEFILLHVFSPGNTFFWYRDMSLAIGLGLLLMPNIGARAHPHLYGRSLSLVWILSFYAFLVGNGERFKYLCLLDLAYTIGRNYGEYKLAGFNPHYYFYNIGSYI